MKIVIELGGGLESVFDNKRNFEVEIQGERAAVKDLIEVMKTKHLTGNADYFVTPAGLRAGILVLVNDADWSLSGEEETPLEHKDKVSFISTLHGG